MLHTITDSRAAFEHVTAALEKLNQYQSNRDLELLQTAKRDLDSALKEDPKYLGALFYRGIVSDLDNHSVEAQGYFETVLESAPSREVRDEAHYNLGVAFYHRFDLENLAKAKAQFVKVIASAKDRELRLLAMANLAQAHAMSMHPSVDQLTRADAGIPATEVYSLLPKEFEEANRIASECLKKVSLRNTEKQRAADAMAHNALGMAAMYAGDYLKSDQRDRLKEAEKALSHFEQASRDLKDDWANTCDIASAYLRLSIWEPTDAAKSSYFEKSLSLLELVLGRLRPNYGFAYYEKGRLLRCAGLFTKSKAAYESALAIPDEVRAVSKPRIERELRLVKQESRQFP